MFRKLKLILLGLPAALVVFFIRLLRPLLTIRLGPLRSERIGHFAINTELYLCERDAHMHEPRTLDIFYYTLPVCNQQLKKMWDRTLHVFQFASLIDKLNRRLPGGKKHMIPEIAIHLDVHGLLMRTQPHLFFTPEEEQTGLKALRKLGIPEGAPFVCFFARDSAYMNSIFPQRDSSYHDYRDSDINSFLLAVEEICERGYYAIRMGAIVNQVLKSDHPKVIDYAAKYRTDFLDIYLSAKCRFFISSNSGIEEVAKIFRRPIVNTNIIPFNSIEFSPPSCLVIFKKLWSRKKERFLTISEISTSEIKNFSRMQDFEQNNIEIINNSPEEIASVATEMDDRLKGAWEVTKEDEELQRKFQLIFEMGRVSKGSYPLVGSEFLRRNSELLK
ncbi:TIGR04372 family glycosyltransferase [Candidatus Omnitrophota bacterium]